MSTRGMHQKCSFACHVCENARSNASLMRAISQTFEQQLSTHCQVAKTRAAMSGAWTSMPFVSALPLQFACHHHLKSRHSIFHQHLQHNHHRHPLPSHHRRPPSTCSLKDGAFEYICATSIPHSLLSTTLIHNTPGVPVDFPPSSAHALDGDGYALLLSFPDGSSSSTSIKIRGRFVRSRAYLREHRANKRLYRNPSGHTLSSDNKFLRASVKPGCANGIFLWGTERRARAFAYGVNSLPVAMELNTLSTRGPSALGVALTDSEALAEERGEVICAQPVEIDVGKERCLVLIAVQKDALMLNAPTAFFTVVNERFEIVQRLDKVKLPRLAVVTDFAVLPNAFVGLLMFKRRAKGIAIVKDLFGLQSDVEEIDCTKGSALVIVPRNGRGKGRVVRLRCKEEGEDGIKLLAWKFVRTRYNNSKEKKEEDVNILDIIAVEVTQGTKYIALHTLHDTSLGRFQTAKLAVTRLASVNISSGMVTRNARHECVRAFARANGDGHGDAVVAVRDEKRGRVGLLSLAEENGRNEWYAEEKGTSVSGVCFAADGVHLSAMAVTRGRNGRVNGKVLIWEKRMLQKGPVCEVALDTDALGDVTESVCAEWSELQTRVDTGVATRKSAWEMFDEKNWNDIDSSFSSLGINQ